MRKITYLIVLIMLILSLLSACVYGVTYKWKVCNQPNTKWVSSDGTIVFFVNNEHLATGTISVNGNTVEVFITNGPERDVSMHIYPIDVLKQDVISEEDKYEYWACSYRSETMFVATVKKSTFYEVGKQIKFYRSDGENAN